MVVSSMITGALVRRIGYYTPFAIIGVCFMSVGAGLLNTLQIDTSAPKWIGYQILYGWGMGLSTQAPNLAAQTVLPKLDIPVGTALMFFSQLLSGAVFVSVAQNVLDSQLIRRLSSVPGLNPAFIQNMGATSLTDLPASIKPTVLAAYNESIRHVFRVGLIMGCLSMIGALLMEWRSTKRDIKMQAKKSEEYGSTKAEGQDENSGRNESIEKDNSEA